MLINALKQDANAIGNGGDDKSVALQKKQLTATEKQLKSMEKAFDNRFNVTGWS